LHRSWEISVAPGADASGNPGKAKCRNPGIRAAEKSDTPKVPKKPSNKGIFPAEMVEGRGVAKGNAEQTSALLVRCCLQKARTESLLCPYWAMNCRHNSRRRSWAAGIGHLSLFAKWCSPVASCLSPLVLLEEPNTQVPQFTKWVSLRTFTLLFSLL
jgi:hypothetical protein